MKNLGKMKIISRYIALLLVIFTSMIADQGANTRNSAEPQESVGAYDPTYDDASGQYHIVVDCPVQINRNYGGDNFDLSMLTGANSRKFPYSERIEWNISGQRNRIFEASGVIDTCSNESDEVYLVGQRWKYIVQDNELLLDNNFFGAFYINSSSEDDTLNSCMGQGSLVFIPRILVMDEDIETRKYTFNMNIKVDVLNWASSSPQIPLRLSDNKKSKTN